MKSSGLEDDWYPLFLKLQMPADQELGYSYVAQRLEQDTIGLHLTVGISLLVA